MHTVPQDSRPSTSEEESHALLDRFVELGGTFIDTADYYSFGLSESIIGNWIAKHPELRKKVICTSLNLSLYKVHHTLWCTYNFNMPLIKILYSAPFSYT